MRLRCHLKLIRGTRSLREIALLAGMAPGELSRIENGISVPRDVYLERLEEAYGAKIVDWYPPSVLLAIEPEEDAAAAIEQRMRRPLLQSA